MIKSPLSHGQFWWMDERVKCGPIGSFPRRFIQSYLHLIMLQYWGMKINCDGNETITQEHSWHRQQDSFASLELGRIWIPILRHKGFWWFYANRSGIHYDALLASWRLSKFNIPVSFSISWLPTTPSLRKLLNNSKNRGVVRGKTWSGTLAALLRKRLNKRHVVHEKSRWDLHDTESLHVNLAARQLRCVERTGNSSNRRKMVISWIGYMHHSIVI